MTHAQLLKHKLKSIDVEQNTPEWLDLRRTKRTASETPIIMGLSPWSSAVKLAQEKFAKDPIETETNAAMEHGHKYENEARRAYEEAHDIMMDPYVFVRGDYMASLDGFNSRRNIVLEIKSPYTHVYSDTWQKAVDGEVPIHYYAQIQHQLMVTDAKLCHFWVYNSRKRHALFVEVKPDRAYFATILKSWELFYQKYA